MDSPGRRRVLELALLTSFGWMAGSRLTRAAGQQGLDAFGVGGPPCKADSLTPGVPTGADYKPNAPVRSSLVEPGATASPIVITGYVVGISCGRIKGARVEFWHADPKGQYDAAGQRYRGQVLTDADGKYRLETSMPGVPAGRAKHLGARVTPPGKPAFTTELFFPDDAAAGRDPKFKPALAMKAVQAAGARTFSFDFVIDL